MHGISAPTWRRDLSLCRVWQSERMHCCAVEEGPVPRRTRHSGSTKLPSLPSASSSAPVAPARHGTMARQLPAHLSHKSALALLPPASITAPIEAVRRVHDKHFARWPPHINLIYPFLASPSETMEQAETSSSEELSLSHLKETIRTRIAKVTQKLEPFRVSLITDPPGTFSHTQRSKTVWLGPSTDHVQQLQSALQAEFSECDSDQRPFTPHLSVGQARSEQGANLLSEEIKKGVREHMTAAKDGEATTALDWCVDKVFVIERKGYKDRFKVVGTIQLGKT